MAILKKLVSDLLTPANLALIPLKACYFFLYSVVFSSLPFISIISTRIASFEQLSLLFAFGTVLSTITPIFVGFLGDKVGTYKPIIIITTLVIGFVHIPLLLLDDQEPQEFITTTTSNGSFYAEVSSSVTHSSYSVPLLFIIRLLGLMGIDATLSLLDASGMAMTKKFVGDFGKQKMWASISIATMPLLTGFIIDTVSRDVVYKDYTIAFYISAGSALVALPILLKLDITVERNTASLLDSIKRIVKMTDVLVFLFIQIVVGTCMGFHLMYLSVFINDELKGSSSLYGICLSCSGISGIIGFATVKLIVNRIGEVNTVAIALVLYCVRFVSFNFLSIPWLILASEVIDGFCGFLAFAAGCYFCAAASPPGLLASLNGILSACTFGIGKGLGSTIGSALIASFGMRATYCMFGILAGATSITYLFIHHTFLKKIELQRKPASAKGELTEGEMSSTAHLEGSQEQVVNTIS